MNGLVVQTDIGAPSSGVSALVAATFLCVGSLVCGGLLGGCAGEAVDAPAATWHKDVRPGLEKWCGSCHVEGGVGPFVLTEKAQAKAMNAPSINALTNGTMPPYRANDDCRQYNGQWMSEAQAAELVSALGKWRDGGYADGNEADYVKPDLPADPLEVAGPPQLVLRSTKAYKPNDKIADDYRCFVLDHVFDKETYLKMSNVLPGQRDLVHHVLVYVVPKSFLGALHGLDDAEDGVGYTCFGGPGVGSPSPIAGWAPGDAPLMAPDDMAVRLPAGSKLVMQVHYNLASAAVEDHTELQLWTTDKQPKFLLNSRPMPNFGIEVPANDKASTHTRLFENKSDKPWHVIGTTPHMHTFGTQIGVDKLDKDGKRECLVDVKRWDFNWQLSYPFLSNEPVMVQPGEKLELRCTYDNTAANQPVVAGKQVTPKLLTWGEGTLDEMCLNYLLVVEPYAPLVDSTAVCDGFDKCHTDCSKTKGDGTCLLECGGQVGGKCQSCVYTATIQCGLTGSCVTDTAPLYECISDCGTETSCIFSKCNAQIATFQTCIGPQIDAGKCGPQLNACGVVLK